MRNMKAIAKQGASHMAPRRDISAVELWELKNRIQSGEDLTDVLTELFSFGYEEGLRAASAAAR